jgi:5-methylcytosine-specific restriction endonuclease McrA
MKGEKTFYPRRKEGFSSSTKKIALERAGGRCECCLKKSDRLHVEHIKPLSQGGSNELSNAQVFCLSCHNEKHEVQDGYSPAEVYRWEAFQKGFFFLLFEPQEQPK